MGLGRLREGCLVDGVFGGFDCRALILECLGFGALGQGLLGGPLFLTLSALFQFGGANLGGPRAKTRHSNIYRIKAQWSYCPAEKKLPIPLGSDPSRPSCHGPTLEL